MGQGSLPCPIFFHLNGVPMGHFAKIRKEDNENMKVDSYDPKNPFSKDMEDEGEWITIINVKEEKELKKEEENGSTND